MFQMLIGVARLSVGLQYAMEKLLQVLPPNGPGGCKLQVKCKAYRIYMAILFSNYRGGQEGVGVNVVCDSHKGYSRGEAVSPLASSLWVHQIPGRPICCQSIMFFFFF